MVFLVKKIVKGNTYLYLEERAWINGKSKRLWQRYLGPEDKIKEYFKPLTRPEYTITTLDFGLPLALMNLIKKLDLIKIINDCSNKRAQGLSLGHYLVLAALNRCVKPTSKAKIRRWFEHTALLDEFPSIETYLDSMAYTNHFKYLTPEVIDKIEARIHKKLLMNFGVEMKTLFYDPTNFFTYINPNLDMELPNHGHSKDGRFTLNLVGLTLFCTHDGGLPIMHEVYPGNIQDAPLFRDELKRIFKRLKVIGVKNEELCLVFDKGNISPKAFDQINDSGIRFICSIRPSTQKDLLELPARKFTLEMLPNGKKVGVLEFEYKKYGENHRLFVVYNPNQREWQENNLKKKLEKRFLEVNDWFKDRLNVNKWREPKNVENKIRDIIKTKAYFNWIKYSVSGTYAKVNYSVEIDKDALDAHLDTLGKTFILTNHPTMKPLEVIWLFRQQYTVERAFSYIKAPTMLSIRPQYCHTDDSIRGHSFSCVLGLLLLTLLTREIRRNYKEMSLPKIVETLSEIELAIINYEGTRKTIKKMVEISKEALNLSKFLKLDEYL